MLTAREEYGYNVIIGALGRKYIRYRDSKYSYIPIEQPLFKLLKKVKTTRAIYIATVRTIDDQEETNERKARAYDLTNKLITSLKALNTNYNNSIEYNTLYKIISKERFRYKFTKK